jgi:hypothetical protein
MEKEKPELGVAVGVWGGHTPPYYPDVSGGRRCWSLNHATWKTYLTTDGSGGHGKLFWPWSPW